MLSHLSHLMDLASRFQWTAVRAFHSHVLKTIEQAITTWHSDFTRFETGILLPLQELVTHTMASTSRSGNNHKKIDKESVCKEWNFSACDMPVPMIACMFVLF